MDQPADCNIHYQIAFRGGGEQRGDFAAVAIVGRQHRIRQTRSRKHERRGAKTSRRLHCCFHVIVLFSDLVDYRDSFGRLELAQMKLIDEKLAQIFGHFIAHVLMNSLIQRAERIAPPSS
jgi:hypothetical protein